MRARGEAPGETPGEAPGEELAALPWGGSEKASRAMQIMAIRTRIARGFPTGSLEALGAGTGCWTTGIPSALGLFH
jgi:hypothetical protein